MRTTLAIASCLALGCGGQRQTAVQPLLRLTGALTQAEIGAIELYVARESLGANGLLTCQRVADTPITHIAGVDLLAHAVAAPGETLHVGHLPLERMVVTAAAFRDPEALGSPAAVGCADGVEVQAGKTLPVTIELRDTP